MTEAMFKLGSQPTFISVVGNDSHGQYLCSLLPAQSSQTVQKLPDCNTAQCTIIFDNMGDCKMLIGDMDIHQQITPNMINRYEKLISESPLLVLDGNLSVSALEAALKLAGKHKVPVFYEPTDVPTADKPFRTAHWKSMKYITPNFQELKQIAKCLNIPSKNSSFNHLEEVAFIAKSLVNFIPNIIVTLSSNGLLVARKAAASDELLYQNEINDCIKIRHYPAEKVKNLVNVSGAGDCLASGIIIAMLKGLSEEQCIKVGYAAAQASLYSESAVPNLLFNETHPSWTSKAEYHTIF